MSPSIIQNCHSTILVLSSPPAQSLKIEVDYVPTFDLFVKRLNTSVVHVIALPLLVSLSSDFVNAYKDAKKRNPALQLILMTHPRSEIQDVLHAMDLFPNFKVIPSFSDPSLEKLFLDSLEKAQWHTQNLNLEKIVISQRQQLQILQQKLEQKAFIRQHSQNEIKQNTSLIRLRWQSFSFAIEAIHKATSLSDMEYSLTRTLQDTFDISFVKIIFTPQEEMFSQKKVIFNEFSVHKSDLYTHLGQNQMGAVFYFRTKNKSFRRDEIEFLNHLSESITLAMGRFQALQESEILKEQWEATFNAVSEVVILINDKYEIIQSNKSFLKKNGNLKCFEALYQKSSPCKECKLGKNFRLNKNQNEIFEVFSHPILLKDEGLVYMNQYYDISEKIKMEKKIIESARMAEIGNIGSSIAHELNNPLGGMYSLLQLILSDLDPKNPIASDIHEMILGVQRCRDIIENLLGFTRLTTAEDHKNIDLRKVLDRAIKITEIQTKSSGIKIQFIKPEEPYLIKGVFNLLSQAFKDVLQNILDKVLESSINSEIKLEICIEMKKDFRQYTILFSDNSPVQNDLHEKSSLVINKIILDHHGKIESYRDASNRKILSLSFPHLNA